MKHTKEFFGVLLSVLICVFLVGLGVWATTTISSDISVEDDLTVTDDLTVNGLASVSETFRVPTIYGNTDAGLYLRIGDQALTSHSLAAQDDLLVTGKLEVDGVAYFDGTASMTGDIWVDRIYGTLGAGYLAIGDAGTTGHSLVAEDDLLVTGKLEVDGNAFFDSTVSVSSSGLILDGGATITTGAASKSGSCTIGSIYLRTDSASGGAAFSICEDTDVWAQLGTLMRDQ